MALKKLFTGIAAVPLLIIAALLIIYFLFLPPILKYIIENQGEKQLGRKVEVGYTTINIFKGSVNINKFRVYEADRQNIFLAFRKFNINFNIPGLFRKVYHIESIRLDEPIIHISQKDSTFNFSDILDRFSSDTTDTIEDQPASDTSEASGPVQYIVENFSLTSGLVSYANPDFKLKDTIKNLTLSLPKLSWDDPVIEPAFFFNIASGGNFRGNIRIDLEEHSMLLRDTIEDFNLANYKHYIDPYLKTGMVNGFLHTRNVLSGNTETFDLKFTGDLSLTGFALYDLNDSLVAGFEKFSVAFDTISFSEDVLSFDTIALIRPVIRYVLSPEGDNISAMLPASATADTASSGLPEEASYAGENPLEMMVSYIQQSMNEYLFSSYRINHIRLQDGKIAYYDRTLEEPFTATIDSLNLDLSQLTTNVARSYGTLDAKLNEEGHFHAGVSVNPRNLLDMDLEYSITSLLVPDFNPFSVHYIAYPFPRGTFNYEGSLVIADRKLKSENKILIEKITIGEKVKNETAVSLPIKLAIAILRDRQGDVSFDVPVKGDLNDPEVKIGRIILDILKNLIIKAATAPYDLLAAAFGGSEEDYRELRFDYMSIKARDKQKRQLENIASILAEKPELKISFTQVIDREKEKAEIALFEARKQYYFESLKQGRVPSELSPEDSLSILEIGPDKDFDHFLNSRLDRSLHGLSTGEKCQLLAGAEKVSSRQESYMEMRNQALSGYLEVVMLIPPERFSVSTSDDRSLINPEYPFYGIKFSTDE